MRDLAQFFSYLNDIDFRYVVLRNWDGLPYDIKVGPHTDLDLLVYDLDHFREIFGNNLRAVYPLPRVQHKLLIGNSYVFTDLRSPTDGYYPYDFSWNILSNRVLNPAGFWTPDPVHHRVALSYHTVHHKGYIDESYRRWLGDTKIEDLAQALKSSHIGWEPPDDTTVGRFNSYIKGATSVVSKGENSVKKKQYRFHDHNLIENEYRLLSQVNNPHFPRVVTCQDDEIEIESCGDPLTIDNLPTDWYEQLVDILRELKKEKIVHRDVRIENLMVSGNTIKLIDFGWARKESEPDENHPDLLGYPNKAPWGFDDAYSVGKVIKQIHAKLEEREEKNENTRT